MAININGTGSITGLSSISSPTISGGSVPLGDATAPGIVFSGDPNTGIYSPGADQVAISTNSTGRLFIDSSGRVGVGTGNPSYALSIKGGSAASQNLLLTWDTDQTDAYSRIRSQFAEGNTSCASEIRFHQRLAQQNGGYQTFWTTNSGGTLVEAMRIDSSQRVGIGNNSPQAIVHATTAGAGQIRHSDGTRTIAFGSTGSETFVGSGANLTFLTNGLTSSEEKARIDTSGRLLVGTSTAQGTYPLQVESSGTGIFLRRNLPNGSLGDGNGLGLIDFGNQSGGIGARIEAVADAGWGAGGSDYPGRLTFSTTPDSGSSPVERVRITNAGRFNVVSTEAGIFAETTQGAGTSFVLFQGRHSATAGSVLSGTSSFQVFSNGNVQNTNNSYTAISDIKLKENVVDAGSQWADLKALRVRNYNLKEGQTHRQIGLIAQEVEPISPGLVYETPDRDAEGNDLGTTTKAVQYSVLYMKAVKALQEAMERIETLEAKVAALEAS